MPLLSHEAKELYVRAYGKERYDKYCDRKGKYHGGVPANVGAAQRFIPYQHRWEYDVESVYWTLYFVLLSVLPRGFSETEETDYALQRYWEILMGHQVHWSDSCENMPQDTRSALLDCDLNAFLKPFPPIMQDVARLLYDMAQHVRIPYASMAELPEHEDHLHEALQRLILEYLLRHRDDPIFLRSTELRIGDPPSVVTECFDPDCASESDVMIIDNTDPEGKPDGADEPEEGTPKVSPLLTGSWTYPYFGSEYIIEDPEEPEV